MTSSKPYLLRAVYEWLVDNRLTPYVMVNAMFDGVNVPDDYIEDGKIVLNVAPQAVAGLLLNNDAVEFDARFSGISNHIYIPINAIEAIYAFENGRGMVFNDDDEDDGTPPPGDEPKTKKGKPNLRVVK